jgi:thiol-disulfide isomerase/thioredoxin
MSESGFSESNKFERPLPPARPPLAPLWPWLLILAALGIVLAWRGFARTAVEPEGLGRKHPAAGNKLPELTLVPLTGDPQPVALSDLEGKVTLLNFWGPWCTFCEVEFPHLIELEQHFRANPDFQFFSISTNPDPFDTQGLAQETAAFLKRHHAEFPTYHDPAAKSQIALVKSASVDNYGYPATLVIDRDLTIRGLWIGYRSGDERSVRQTIEDTLRRKQPVSTGQASP